jgi:hypothetical protein
MACLLASGACIGAVHNAASGPKGGSTTVARSGPTTDAATSTAGKNAPCTPNILFKVAAAAEHFNPNDPRYHQVSEDVPAQTTYVVCADGWAVAVMSRPVVGNDDGTTLFRSNAGGRWEEVAIIGQIDTCNITAQGVPNTIAVKIS